MKAQLRDKWADALESGEYRQTKGQLVKPKKDYDEASVAWIQQRYPWCPL